MGKFYLDMEFTNGNYYLSDILEIALIAEESVNAFHSYVSLPKRVHKLTGIAHGGYLHDFPILLANCMKHDYDFHLTAIAIDNIVHSILNL